jgi:hypothetical protein
MRRKDVLALLGNQALTGTAFKWDTFYVFLILITIIHSHTRIPRLGFQRTETGI